MPAVQMPTVCATQLTAELDLLLTFFGKHIYRLNTPLAAVDPVDP